MINFILPGFYLNFNLNKQLLQCYYDYPEFFYDNINLYAIYDSFPWNIFSGGREPNNDRHATIEDIYIIMETFKNLEIRQICTNSLITEQNLSNRFANICLKLLENPKNGIVINNLTLLNYIKNQYPKYKIILSTTACNTNTNNILSQLNDPIYNLICLDYNINNNFDFLNNLTQSEKDKCEFLVNPVCIPNCKERALHYKQISESFLNFFPHSARVHHCYRKDKIYCSKTQWEMPTVISPQQIFEIYEPNGFSYFKLEDRTLPSEILAKIYITYLIKPQFQLKILQYLLK